jgi:two-component system, OmpR family, sensor kinase
LAARIAVLEQALRLRDEFLSVAAHELRNPMHSLLLQVSAAVHAARQQGTAGLVRRLERVQHTVDAQVRERFAGYARVLRKPFRVTALVEAVRRTLADRPP